jgi:hypothetical protein
MNMALKDGGTAPASIGCRENPDYPACITGRVSVQLLARGSMGGATIVRLNGRNYVVGGLEWAYERLDGTAIGGPIMVQAADGEILPLHHLLRGMTQEAHQAQEQQRDDQRKKTITGILRIKGERCDDSVSVSKDSEGSFTVHCVVKGKSQQYVEGISGLQ